MKPGINHDQLEVINGPEDGGIFHLVRTPMDLGADPQCGVTLQLDAKLQPLHARLTVVSNGYRIRGFAKAEVSVNGKRAGSVRSQILRSGDILRVGGTELALFCSEEGLARRSQGIKNESDIKWALQQIGHNIAGLFRAPKN